MIRAAAMLAVLIACHAPNVPRLVIVWPRTAVVQYPSAVKCHADGPCWTDPPYAAYGDAVQEMRCLSPKEERDAEDRGP